MRTVRATLAFLLAFGLQPLVAGDPVIHVLIQFPLLACSGWLLAQGRHPPPETSGPLLALGLTTAIVWMLPRSVDAAISEPAWTLAKFVTLPLATGLPLGLAWGRIDPLWRGVLKAQAISMLLFLAFLYIHAPVRICNAYLIDDQVRLGAGFAIAAALLAAGWTLPALAGTGRR